MSRLRNTFDTLQSSLSQSVETITRNARIDISGSDVDEIDPPEDIDQYVQQAKQTAIVRANLRQFVNDVWGPGYRVEGPDRTVAYFEGDKDELSATPPEDTPEGGFLNNCFVYGGEKRQDFYTGGKQATWERWVRGTVLVEYLKAEAETPDSEITGFYHIRPETVHPQVYSNTNILIDPDETGEDGVVVTKRGEAAAYIQFDDNSILGLRRDGFDEDSIPLSQNDVLKQTLDPDIGGDSSDAEGVFGTSIMESINEDVEEYNTVKRDRAEAIRRIAYGIHTAQFTPETIDLGNQGTEIIEWDDESISDTEDELNDLGPGSMVTADAGFELERFAPDVPELNPALQHYVDDITSALPAPKYMVGHSDETNRDVTSEQSKPYEDLVSEERQYQQKSWTEALKVVAERKGLPTEGLRLRIEPPPEDNPVKALESDTIDDLLTYMKALNEAAGPSGGPATLVDHDTLIDTLELPEDAKVEDFEMPSEGEMSEDEEALFRDAMGLETAGD
jgi:hypothetical protein